MRSCTVKDPSFPCCSVRVVKRTDDTPDGEDVRLVAIIAHNAENGKTVEAWVPPKAARKLGKALCQMADEIEKGR